MSEQDERFMDRCLDLARAAEARGEVPIGALCVYGGEIVGEGANTREAARNPLGHAEMDALRQASEKLGRWRLTGVTLYVTLEPCAMCAGAAVLSRVDRVVYATRDPKAGAIDSLYGIGRDPRLNHCFEVAEGPRQKAAAQLLSQFFKTRRKKRSPMPGS